jgi:hypothetical protein
VQIRFNHMEITLPLGSLTEAFRADVAAFYGDVYGFGFSEAEMFGQPSCTMRLSDGSFILLIEGPDPMQSEGFDHLGFELASRAEVDDSLAKVKQWMTKDERIELKEYADGALEGRFYHAYYVKHLLPIWFDVQYSEVVADPA